MGTRSGFSCLNALSNLSLDVILLLLSALGSGILSQTKCGGLHHPLLSHQPKDRADIFPGSS